MSAALGPEVPGLVWLGCGYDIFGKYCDSDSTKKPIIDTEPGASTNKGHFEVEGVVFEYPSSIQVMPETRTYIDENEGESALDFLRKLNNTTKIEGDVPYFGGSLSWSVDNSEDIKESCQFNTIKLARRLYKLSIPLDKPQTLKVEVQQDVDSLEPEELFKRYGTHVLTSFLVGGCCEYVQVTDSRSYSKAKSNAVDASGKIKAFEQGAITLSEVLQWANELSKSNKSIRTKFTSKGGDGVISDDIKTFGEWCSSVIKAPAMYDFVDENSLTPIWNYAKSPDRQKALKDYFEEYKKKQQRDLALAGIAPFLQGKLVRVTKQGPNDGGDTGIEWVNVGTPDMNEPSNSGWYFLGQTAFGGSQMTTDHYSLIVKEIVPGSLAPIEHWERVWEIKLWKEPYDYLTLWKGFAGDQGKYIVLGDYLKKGENVKPTAEETKSMRAVTKEALKKYMDDSQEPLWTDKWAHTPKDTSVWLSPILSEFILDLKSSENLPMTSWSDSDIRGKTGLYIASNTHHKPQPPRFFFSFKHNAVELTIGEDSTQ